MKYRRANEVLPDELLKEISKYVDGEALYFPKKKERKNWGEDTGSRNHYRLRNSEIKEKFLNGASTEALADEYNLSIDSIRKILYR